ncbi:MAG: T9SS type A sorting domain-containing protein, partial [Bacteroidia bacterium]|nr:T9SS type A sorting domain-containing protein [Bacteroidia bacterium]
PNLIQTFVVYPNPSRDDARVKFSLRDVGAAELALYDLTGRKVWSERVWGTSGEAIVPRPQNPGLYVLELRCGDGALRLKVSWY